MATAERRCAHVTTLYGREQIRRFLTEATIDARVIQHRGQDVEVLIKRSRRKTIAIHVYPDKPVELRAPLKCAWRDIDDFLASKLDWIVRSKEDFARRPPVRSYQYVEGEYHSYLGDSWRLALVKGRPKTVELLNDSMVVRCDKPREPEVIRRAIDEWYRARAREVLPERLTACFTHFASRVPDFMDRKQPSLAIRKMRARWGSCSSTGQICLNSCLVQRSVEMIDYVIMHELCHLKHFAHNKSFYRLMDRVMPDWRDRAAVLDR